MAEFDLVIKNGTIATAAGTARCDVGVRGGKIVALADALDGAAEVIDATDRLVLPGGVDSHCHIAQTGSLGVESADDFRSGSISAAWLLPLKLAVDKKIIAHLPCGGIGPGNQFGA